MSDPASPRRLSHLGLAVRDLDAAIRLYRDVFGLEVERRWESEGEQIRAAALRLGDVEIELMEPISEDSPVGRFVARRGEGLHHIAFEVADIERSLAAAREAGLEFAGEAPRPGGTGDTEIGFLHPRGTFGVLIELEQDVKPRTGA
jgi:methylmalonyl-CoA/ethylmalonyl-CoA epimerase